MLQKLFRKRPFEKQLVATVGVALIFLALLSAIIASASAVMRLERHLIEESTQLVASIAKQSALGLLFHSTSNAEDSIDQALGFRRLKQIVILDLDGKTLAAKAAEGDVENLVDIQAVMRVSTPTIIDDNFRHWRFAAPVTGLNKSENEPFDLKPSVPQKLGYVVVDIDKSAQRQLVAWLVLGNLIATLTAAVILVAGVRNLVRHLTDPLNRLSELMGEAEGGTSSVRAIPDGPQDIVNMALAFNRMMDRLDAREADLRQSRDDAIKTAIMRTEFAAAVSHEVRTPLNGIVGMLDLLRDTRLTQQQKEYMDVAWSSARTLVDMLNDILDFSKIDAGKLELEEAEFDLHKTVEEVFSLFVRQAQNKGIQMGYSISPSVPDRICGDALRLRQVLLNLVGNAVKFTDAGEVTIRIKSTFEDLDRMILHFEVTDTGIGMSESVVEHIFDEYTQAERSTSRKYGGSGLGLAICKKLVGLMNGQIGVRSVVGMGSTFWFTARCKPGVAVAADVPNDVLINRKALIVDESEVVRDFVFQALTSNGMNCTAVSTGDEALTTLNEAGEGAFDIVIADASITDSHGANVGMRIRSNESVRPPSVLTLDLYSSPNSMKVLGSNWILGKPLSREKLLSVVAKLLSNRPIVKPSNSSNAEVAALPGATILLAEDNRSSQIVISSMLHSAGYRCDIVKNGRLAVEQAKANAYDLILMDCNMPEMDGYESTAHIRRFEAAGKHRVPIVALTANADYGDADKCLAAGMDDYLFKPVTTEILTKKVREWLGKTSSRKMEQLSMLAQMGVPDVDDTPVDQAVFESLRMVLGEALGITLRQFMEDTPEYMRRLEQGLAAVDLRDAMETTHALKGSCGNIGAQAMAHLCKEIEDSLHSNDRVTAVKLLPDLSRAYQAVAEALTKELFAGEQKGQQIAHGSARILIVDDDRSTRSMLRATLEPGGFDISEVRNGQEALDALDVIRPDLILMDASMPVMDGFTACERLQETPLGKSIPVIMITALEDQASIERAFAVGASDYIAKPIHLRVLSERLRRIIDACNAKRRLDDIANNDALTGLPTRPMFFQKLQGLLNEAGAEGRYVSVFLMDLDRFKNVNEAYGMDVGDKLLVAVSQRIQQNMRSAECIARFGGDIFGIILITSKPEDAPQQALNLAAALSRRFDIDGNDVFVANSIGVSTFPRDANDESTLLKHAESAMRQAKRSSSPVAFFEASMEQPVSEHARIVAELHRALARGELEVYYQPLVSVASGKIVGVEALVRWNHPQNGLLKPAEFIPQAEESGLINDLGKWVLRTACTQMRAWIDSGIAPMRIAVNVSEKQLRRSDFAKVVATVLHESRLQPDLLELEIAESFVLDMESDAVSVLSDIRKFGVRLSIDGFGTGYAAEDSLMKLPINGLKIDRSFIRDVAVSPDDAEIVKSVIALAHSLRLEVVAVGVENEEQHRFLEGLDCHVAQGHLLSIPVPGSHLPNILAGHAERWASFSHIPMILP